MKEKLCEAIQSLDNIAIYPKIYGLSSYLNSFDYLFMPSNFEGLGLLSVEASLAQTPTIINKCTGLIETLPEDWELSVQNNSVEEFIQLFTRIQEYNYSDLCDKAYQFATSHFSIGKMQRAYESMYEQPN